MTDAVVDTPASSKTDRTQILAAILLGVAATLTAFASYNAALADGDSLQGFTTSTRSLNDANAFYAQGNVTAASDQALFVEYANANFAGETDRAEYLTTLMRPELVDAVAWWNANDAAVTPFDADDANPYTIEDFVVAEELETQAQQQFDAAAADDKRGDIFELAAVFFALTLFFGGIATMFGARRVVTSLLGLSVLTLAVGVINLVRAV